MPALVYIPSSPQVTPEQRASNRNAADSSPRMVDTRQTYCVLPTIGSGLHRLYAQTARRFRLEGCKCPARPIQLGVSHHADSTDEAIRCYFCALVQVSYLIAILSQNQFEVFYSVPHALKLLSETPRKIEVLGAVKIVIYGGSACPDDLGNLLVENGVHLVSHYGAQVPPNDAESVKLQDKDMTRSTQIGQLMTSFRPQEDKAWKYFREMEKIPPFLYWKTFLFTAAVPETEVADKFVKHSLRGLWRAKSNQPTSKTVVVVAGPCATGRTTVGTAIANEANVPFIEGASLHTEAAVANMRADIAVTEDYRMAWLDRVVRRTAEVSPSLATAKSL
ncbi:AMP-binding enzyme [Metarhizium robertsii]|uniref:Glucokinase n=2 Tax=Metarhizium robertsii TaxID=568076 RepID=E9FDB7_METRA|nr:glucokinase [Metarhizium robertsii ARSEF 23]EFY94283.1 glucokinase [Metarhizium robertsii ARSEF 23]EXU97052.1 AMP-binding enzyme [Metarhizium robertsii]